MAFVPLRLLVAYDPEHGLCARAVPRLVELLRNRAFDVDTLEIPASPEAVDLAPYRGLVLGTPALGIGRKGAGPSPRVSAFVQAQGGLEELRVAVFCVYQLFPGYTLRNTQQLVRDHGGEVVATQAWPWWNTAKEAHTLPAECMVRIR